MNGRERGHGGVVIAHLPPISEVLLIKLSVVI